MFFKKHENVKRTVEKREESAHHGMSIAACLGAIWLSKSVEWHSSRAKWHTAPPSYIHAIPCNFALSDIFLRLINIQKKNSFFFFGVKLRHSNVSNSPIFKKSSLISLFSKIDQIKFFLGLMDLCSKLGAFAHASFIFKKSPSSSFQKKKIIITKISKNHAFTLN